MTMLSSRPPFLAVATATTWLSLGARRRMVNLHGNSSMHLFRSRGPLSAASITGGIHNVSERPPDPRTLLTEEQLTEKVEELFEWWKGKKQVLCITGAGLSTESGIPDYRGNEGSYHRGHKPIVHDQFMKSEHQRKRYWGRGMVGWRFFDEKGPNAGHNALAELESLGKLGVAFEDEAKFYGGGDDDLDWTFSSGQRKLSLVTQNVDNLHRIAGSRHLIELHGRINQLKCMQCGTRQDRHDFHSALEKVNTAWLSEALKNTDDSTMRPDGDAALKKDNYEEVVVPACDVCGDGFFKPDVVFFGDTVPKHRVAQCQAAVENADGVLVVGSSLAVHSAYRHVRAASQRDVPIAILNVGETRAEAEGLNILKFEAPAGPTLSAIRTLFKEHTN